jgi:hypothetical protein
MGAGVIAAGVAELAAGLCESIARTCAGVGAGPGAQASGGGGWEEARGAAVQASVLRGRAERAAAANAVAYAAARDALRQPATPAGERDALLHARLTSSADTLLEIVAIAVDCAVLSAEIASRCVPELRPDAAGAAELAAAAGRSAASLVEINLALGAGDERRLRAQALVEAAVSASAGARQAVLD